MVRWGWEHHGFMDLHGHVKSWTWGVWWQASPTQKMLTFLGQGRAGQTLGVGIKPTPAGQSAGRLVPSLGLAWYTAPDQSMLQRLHGLRRAIIDAVDTETQNMGWFWMPRCKVRPCWFHLCDLSTSNHNFQSKSGSVGSFILVIYTSKAGFSLSHDPPGRFQQKKCTLSPSFPLATPTDLRTRDLMARAGPCTRDGHMSGMNLATGLNWFQVKAAMGPMGPFCGLHWWKV